MNGYESVGNKKRLAAWLIGWNVGL